MPVERAERRGDVKRHSGRLKAMAKAFEFRVSPFKYGGFVSSSHLGDELPVRDHHSHGPEQLLEVVRQVRPDNNAGTTLHVNHPDRTYIQREKSAATLSSPAHEVQERS